MELISQITQALRLRRYHIRILIAIGLIFVGFLVYISEPPAIFPNDTLVTVQVGDTLNSIAKDLKSKQLIRSTIFLKSIVILFAGEQKLVAGDYSFSHPISAYNIANRLVNGDFDLSPIRVTIPEGVSMSQIATLLSPKLKHFLAADFMKYSPEKEGYLFPDTYFFAPDVKAKDVIDIMQKNFTEKIKTVEPIIAASGKTEKDIIIMASILEEEARTPEDWQTISSVLWKRIKIGMLLQVNPPLSYITGRTDSELTKADLKMDSSYNTYVHKGLPSTPISSPGLKTIVAAATPTTTPYLYYLSDANGVIHYAATFAEHVKNRQKYQ